MDIEEFRKRGYETVDRICKYYQEIDNYDVISKVEPGYLEKLLPDEAPEDPESWDEIQSDIETKIFPGVTHWQSPNFFAFYPATSSFPAILGDMYSDMFNCIGFNWICSPACTELETIVLDWIAKLINLDSSFLSKGKGGGVIQGTASEGILVALIAARQRVLDEYKNKGLSEKELDEVSIRLIAYASDQAHSAVKKATMIANTKFALFPTDENYSLRGETVKKIIEEDIAKGLIPFFINATIGTTSTAAVDHIVEIAEAIEGTSIWLNVDAAYAGAALICPEYQHYSKGVEKADSFGFNMHKWLLTTFDCSCFWIKDRSFLLNALSITPAFLRNAASESGLVLDYRDWQIPYHFYKEILRYPELFKIAAPYSFSLVCFYVIPPAAKENQFTSNELTEKVLNKLNDTKQVFITHTQLGDQMVIRFPVSGYWTKKEHVDKALNLIIKFTKELIGVE
ncbi:2508_t:CDS:2 [Entrophospora sp. SA101]|nr:2508_t:CDS:2 [Entrophospora sp. SA101]